MKISYAVALLLSTASVSSIKVHSDIHGRVVANIKNNANGQQRAVGKVDTKVPEKPMNERMLAWAEVSSNVNEKEYLESQEIALNEQVIGQNRQLDQNKQLDDIPEIGDILSSRASLKEQDAEIKRMVPAPVKAPEESFEHKYNTLIPREPEELSEQELGLDSEHKSHLLMQMRDPTQGDIPTPNQEKIEAIANVIGAPKGKNSQDDLVKKVTDDHANKGALKAPEPYVPQVHVEDVVTLPAPKTVKKIDPIEHAGGNVGGSVTREQFASNVVGAGAPNTVIDSAPANDGADAKNDPAVKPGAPTASADEIAPEHQSAATAAASPEISVMHQGVETGAVADLHHTGLAQAQFNIEMDEEESESPGMSLAAKLQQQMDAEKDPKSSAFHDTQFMAIKQRENQAVLDKVNGMNVEMQEFSKTLQMSHYDKAIDLQRDLKKEGLRDHEQLMQVNTKDLFKQGFQQFPQIVQNEYVQDQLAYLEAAEDNLNNNLINVKLAQAFVDRANEVAGNLQKQYGEQWVNPLK